MRPSAMGLSGNSAVLVVRLNFGSLRRSAPIDVRCPAGNRASLRRRIAVWPEFCVALSAVEFAKEPRAGEGPAAVDGAGGDAERLGSLVDAQARVEPEPHDRGRLREFL